MLQRTGVLLAGAGGDLTVVKVREAMTIKQTFDQLRQRRRRPTPDILYHIDTPLTAESDGPIAVAGWALSRAVDGVQVRATMTGGTDFDVPLNVRRPDVVSAMGRTVSDQCGFAFFLNMQEYKGGARLHLEFRDRDTSTRTPEFVFTYSRTHYPAVWDRLSVSEHDAKMVVAGLVEEERFDTEAETTQRVLVECVGITPTDVVLEIGAGVGRVGKVLAPVCREWIGADVSANMLGHLERRLHHLTNVRTVLLNGDNLSPLQSDSVDVVYCTVVFMHLHEWDRFRYVQEGWRVLRPGGRIFIDNFNLLSDAGWAVFESVALLAPLQRPPHISRSSTPQELTTYLERAGFVGIGQKTDGQWIRAYGTKPSERWDAAGSPS